MKNSEMDAKMLEKGYILRLTPRDKSFEPLYVKSIAQASQLMRETYPNKTFFTKCIKPRTK